jgi:hypothetical protein
MKTLEIPDDVYDLLEAYRAVFNVSQADAIRSAFEKLGIQADTEPYDPLEESEVLQSQAARLAGQFTIPLQCVKSKPITVPTASGKHYVGITPP